MLRSIAASRPALAKHARKVASKRTKAERSTAARKGAQKRTAAQRSASAKKAEEVRRAHS